MYECVSKCEYVKYVRDAKTRRSTKAEICNKKEGDSHSVLDHMHFHTKTDTNITFSLHGIY